MVLACLPVLSIASEVKLVGQQLGVLQNARNSKECSNNIHCVLTISISNVGTVAKKSLELQKGSTVVNAVESVYKVLPGLVCSDSRDLWSINGLACDPYNEHWWIIRVNGNEQNVNSRTVLYEGDRVELFYLQKRKPTHVRLEDWLWSNVKK